MARLVCYVDESGIHAGAPAFCLAGWIAPEDEWARFSERWRAVLVGAGLGGQLFHATDCEARRGSFEGWERSQTVGLITSLVDVLVTTSAFGHAVVVDRRSGEETSKGREWLALEPYSHAVPELIGFISQLAGGFLDGEQRIDYVMEHQRDYAHPTTVLFNSMRDETDLSISNRMGKITYGRKGEHVPLQAADLLAYEVRKELERQMRDSHRPERLALARLRATRRVSASDMTGRAAGIDAFLSKTIREQGGIHVRKGNKPGSRGREFVRIDPDKAGSGR